MRLLLTVVSAGADRDVALDVGVDTPVGALTGPGGAPGDWHLGARGWIRRGPRATGGA